MIWAQAWMYEPGAEPFTRCQIAVNGGELPNTESGAMLKNGHANLSIISAATLSGGGSTVALDCTSGDNNLEARLATIALLKIDTLN